MYHSVVLAALDPNDLRHDQLYRFSNPQHDGVPRRVVEKVTCHFWDHRSCSNILVSDVQASVLRPDIRQQRLISLFYVLAI